MHDVTAEQLQRASQDDRRNHAVDVIIAMDRDSLSALDCSEQPVDRRRHVGKLEGIEQMVEGGVEKTRGRVGVPETSKAQQARHHWVNLQARGERARLRVRAGQMFPEQGPHDRLRIWRSWTRRRGRRAGRRQPHVPHLAEFVVTLGDPDVGRIRRDFRQRSPERTAE